MNIILITLNSLMILEKEY